MLLNLTSPECDKDDLISSDPFILRKETSRVGSIELKVVIGKFVIPELRIKRTFEGESTVDSELMGEIDSVYLVRRFGCSFTVADKACKVLCPVLEQSKHGV